MNRTLTTAVVALAACRHPTSTREVKPIPKPPDAAVAVVVTPVSPAIVKHVDQKRAMIEAPHAGQIRAFATTPDGKSAISADEADGIRLWPALDGSTEPRVVDLPRPKLVALGRDGADFLVALIDEVGGLQIATVDAEGRTRQKATIESELAFVGIAMTPQGPLGWRNDQTIVQLDKDGTATSILPVEPGERLVALVMNGANAVAILEKAVDDKTTRHPRYLKLGATLAWGESVALDGDVGTVVGLSPSGKRLATAMVDPKTGLHILIYDLATRKLVGNHINHAATAVAMIDEDKVALIQQNAIEFVDAKPAGAPPADPAGVELFTPPTHESFGIGNGRVITPRNDELVLASPTETRYLGYGLQSPNVAAVGGKGHLLVGLGESFAILDKDLRQVVGANVLAPAGSSIQEVHWLGGDDWLVESTNQNDGKTTLALVDLAKHDRKELRTGLPVAPIVMFEPTTNIVTLSLGDAPEALKYNAEKRTLDKLMTLPKPNGFEQRELVPVAPSLANGAQLISVQMREVTTLRWSKSATSVDVGPSVALDGTLAGTDRAGHVFVWQNGPDKKLALVAFADGKSIGTLPTEGPTTVWPDDNGTRLAEVSGRAVTLVGLDGKAKWTLPIQAASEAHWLDDGALALISAVGIARVDASTGKITATRCGWQFGLSAAPHPFAIHGEPICVQPADAP